MRKTGVFLWFGYPMGALERICLIRRAGFETVMHWWDDSHVEQDGAGKEKQAELIRGAGLEIENAHLKFDHANDLWRDTLDGRELLARYLSDIDGLAAHNIPVGVLHPSRGAPPPLLALGRARFVQLADRAERRGVKLALENVRSQAPLFEILDNIDSPALGLCYDSGHDFLWSSAPYALLNKYKDRLFAVHLHDNHGGEDEHLAPGEGRIDWARVLGGISNTSYAGALTLEADSAHIPRDRAPLAHLLRSREGLLRSMEGIFV